MSSKEEQKQRKQQLQAAAKRKAQLRKWGAVAALVVMVPLVVIVLMQGVLRSVTALPPDTVGPGDHVRGAGEGGVVVTVYADFQCPACLEEMQVVARAWPQVEDDARLVFRHFPLDTHRHAFLAARYAEAASRQGRFWEMHDLLFVNQGVWGLMEDAEAAFDNYALQLGLDLDQVHQDIADPEVRDKILTDQRGGISAGVRGTPTLFIDGRMAETPRTASQFVRMVEAAQE